jgi:hypothetical protein
VINKENTGYGMRLIEMFITEASKLSTILPDCPGTRALIKKLHTEYNLATGFTKTRERPTGSAEQETEIRRTVNYLEQPRIRRLTGQNMISHNITAEDLLHTLGYRPQGATVSQSRPLSHWGFILFVTPEYVGACVSENGGRERKMLVAYREGEQVNTYTDPVAFIRVVWPGNPVRNILPTVDIRNSETYLTTDQFEALADYVRAHTEKLRFIKIDSLVTAREPYKPPSDERETDIGTLAHWLLSKRRPLWSEDLATVQKSLAQVRQTLGSTMSTGHFLRDIEHKMNEIPAEKVRQTRSPGLSRLPQSRVPYGNFPNGTVLSRRIPRAPVILEYVMIQSISQLGTHPWAHGCTEEMNGEECSRHYYRQFFDLEPDATAERREHQRRLLSAVFRLYQQNLTDVRSLTRQ